MSPPARKSPRSRAIRLGVVIALAILAGTVIGGITPPILAWISGSAAVRYSIAACLLTLSAWLVRRIIRTWNDPYAQMLKHYSFLQPALLLFAAIAVVIYPWHRRSAGMEKKVPGEVWQALRSPGQMILYSIDPLWEAGLDMDGKPIPENGEKFHDNPILGSVNLDGAKAIAAARAFQTALDQPDMSLMDMALCFFPRHALRITSSGHVYDFLLCYECQRMEVFRDGLRIVSRAANGSPAVLNALLTSAGIPLAKAPGE